MDEEETNIEEHGESKEKEDDAEIERKKALKQNGKNTRRNHLGCLQRPLRGKLQEMENQLA